MIQLIYYDFFLSANTLKCDIPAIRAVDEVESGGNGFLKSGKLKILFEGHYFYRFTGGKYAKDNPTICYPKWTEQFYLYGEREYERFDKAFQLDPHAAMLSCSWGRYQIMGANYTTAGYRTVDEMIDDYKKAEFNQLRSFVHYIMESGLNDELANHNWAAFAYKYNGASYQRNHYDAKLAAAYEKFKNQL